MRWYQVEGIVEGPLGEMPFRQSYQTDNIADAVECAKDTAQDAADGELTVYRVTDLDPDLADAFEAGAFAVEVLV